MMCSWSHVCNHTLASGRGLTGDDVVDDVLRAHDGGGHLDGPAAAQYGRDRRLARMSEATHHQTLKRRGFRAGMNGTHDCTEIAGSVSSAPPRSKEHRPAQRSRTVTSRIT